MEAEETVAEQTMVTPVSAEVNTAAEEAAEVTATREAKTRDSSNRGTKIILDLKIGPR